MIMYKETLAKINNIANELKISQFMVSYNVDFHSEDDLEIQVLMHLLLAKSVNIVDCSFVNLGIQQLIEENSFLFDKLKNTDKDISVYDIEKKLCYFASNKTELLKLRFVFYDVYSNQQHLIEPEVFVKSSKENNFIHPVTLEPIQDFKKYIYPIYFPTEKLKKFRHFFARERECQAKNDPKPFEYNSRNDRAERTRALRIIR